MKKFFPILLFGLIGCEQKVTSISEPDKDGIRKISIIGHLGDELNLVEIKIDGCEYIVINRGTESMMSHKGACKACQKRLEETLKRKPE